MSASGLEFRERAVNLGERLQRAFLAALEEVGAPVERNKALAERLGITPVLASRLRKMLAKEDPAQALLVSPGEGPLQAVSMALARLGATADACSRIDSVLVAIRGFIASEAGDRRALETLLADHVEGGRPAFEAPRRQAVFRSLSEARGLHADLVIHSAFLTPMAGGGVSFSTLLGIHALERTRAGAQHSWLVRRRLEKGPQLEGPTVHHGHKSGALESGEGLARFCLHPPAPLEMNELGEDLLECRLGPTGFGPPSRVDVISLEQHIAQVQRSEPDPGRLRGVGFTPQIPARRIVVEMIAHRELFGGRPPLILAGSTIDRGPLDMNDPEQRALLAPPSEEVEALSPGLSGLELRGLHMRRELLQETFARLGQEPRDFHGWRLEVPFAYPWYQYFFCWEGLG